MNELEQGTVSMSLEEAPEVVTPAVTTPPVETPAPATEEADPDGTISGAGGIKFVPLGAVKAERERRQAAEKAVKDKDTEVAGLKEKAQRYDEASQYLEQARPIIEKIKARPDILKLADQPPAPVTPVVDPAAEAEAVEYAKNFDLYTPEGKPDVPRAMRIIKFHDDRAAKQAQQAVHPILKTEAERQAQANFQHFVNQPEVNGYKIDPRLLREAFDNVGEVAADPRVAQVLFMNTLGRQIIAGHKPITAPPPVVPTEALGGQVSQERPLTETSQRFMSAAGISKKSFTELREQFKPGQTNSLE